MRIDFESGNFVGAGEDATFNILKYLTGLPERHLKEFKSGLDGIYRQVPITWLLRKEDLTDLREDFAKGSIDIFIIFGERRIAVRVQGKKGNLKMQRESVQMHLLEYNKIETVDIHKRECKKVFKELVTEEAIQSIRDSFKTYKVEIPVVIGLSQNS